FCSSSSPDKPLAIIFPSLSTSTLKGIASTWYDFTTSASHFLSSPTCGHVMWSFFIASFHASAFSSRETPNISKFLFLNLRYSSTTFGFSFRHGAHQLAQKSINTTFPLKEEREI